MYPWCQCMSQENRRHSLTWLLSSNHHSRKCSFWNRMLFPEQDAVSGTELVNLILLQKHKVQNMKYALKHEVKVECSGISTWNLRDCQPSFGFAGTPVLLWRLWTSNTHQMLVEMIRAGAWVSVAGGDEPGHGRRALWLTPAALLVCTPLTRRLLAPVAWAGGGVETVHAREALCFFTWGMRQHRARGSLISFPAQLKRVSFPAQVFFLKDGVTGRTSTTLRQHRDFCEDAARACCPSMLSSWLSLRRPSAVLSHTLRVFLCGVGCLFN